MQIGKSCFRSLINRSLACRSDRIGRLGCNSDNATAKCPARMSGAFARWPDSFAVGLAAARPDQGVGLGVFVVEAVGIARSVEARIVQLDREIIAALVGALQPGGPDLGATDVDPVARSVVVGPVGLRDDSDAL